MSCLLKKGAVGRDAFCVQRVLNYHLPKVQPALAEDGIFGPKTKARVHEFQELNVLEVDGIVGPQTWSKLFGMSRLRGQIRFIAADAAPHRVMAAGPRPMMPLDAARPRIATGPRRRSTLIQAGGSFNVEPLAKHNDFMFTFDLNFLRRLDGRHEVPLHLSLHARAKGSYEQWGFKADVWAEPFQFRLMDFLEVKGLTKLSADLDEGTISAMIGAGLSVDVTPWAFKKSHLTIGVDAGPKVVFDFKERRCRFAADLTGILGFQFWF